MPNIDYNVDRIATKQACRTALQTEPIKSAPQHKPTRKLLERHIEDMKREPPDS